ncbi:MAG: long-chain fatty acid--CoA ligase [Acidobacteria bacterium]|nr:long-chain fatty acid--CoA ligase [Acidobacteriota bacterium]
MVVDGTTGQTYDYLGFRRLAAALVEALRSRHVTRLGVCTSRSAAAICLLMAADAAGISVCILSTQFSPEEVSEQRTLLDLHTLVTDDPLLLGQPGTIELSALWPAVLERGVQATVFPPLQSHPAARCLVLTTGTTGRPKGAIYSFGDLLAQARTSPSFAGQRWLLTFRLNHFAGLQVLSHVISNGATLCLPASPSMVDMFRAMTQHAVDCISATPTFWRLFCLETPSSATRLLPVRQITIGGEPVGADVLARLAEWFPQARISQVFATTEVGSCFSVRDGRRGFPAALLSPEHDASTGTEGSSLGPAMRIIDGQLFVRVAHGMLGYYGEPEIENTRARDSWRPTNDLVRIEPDPVEGDRVVFLGRMAEVINVGGVKVHPVEVEGVIREVPGVVDVRVWGRPNPITGAVVAADLVIAEAQREEDMIEQVRQACGRRLDRYSQPRLLRVVPELIQANHKVLRRAGLAGMVKPSGKAWGEHGD